MHRSFREVLTLAALASGTANCSASERVWVYLDVQREVKMVLFEADGTLVIGDESVPATFCDPDTGYRCIVSTLLEFAVSLEYRGGVGRWAFGDRVYCVVDLFEAGGLDEVLLLSKQGQECDYPFDTWIVYSPTFGLRTVVQNHPAGGRTHLHALDKVGFGAK